ncbi:hypothetical protein IMZ48_02670 [Candidatus Bathyarchaeota archaeon]|nr:hypothetical protein [Candidatus Bathyarchaeota archaeon]
MAGQGAHGRAVRLTPTSAQIEPGWHAWISYLVDKPPTEDPLLRTKQRPWEKAGPLVNNTATRGAFKTYSTLVSPFSLLFFPPLGFFPPWVSFPPGVLPPWVSPPAHP